jgi:NAD(P)H-dependent FMN reductase
VLNDDVNGLLSDVQTSDVLVFATPIYYYEMSGQLKTFLDRLNPLYPRTNAFKDVYLLATAADGELSATDGAVKGIQGWIDCFDGVTLKGLVFGGNAEAKGDVNNSDAPKRAYQMGKKV